MVLLMVVILSFTFVEVVKVGSGGDRGGGRGEILLSGVNDGLRALLGPYIVEFTCTTRTYDFRMAKLFTYWRRV